MTRCECGHTMADHQTGEGPWTGFCYGDPEQECKCESPRGGAGTMTGKQDEVTTTWGDCPNRDCMEYGELKYGIEPGDLCEPAKGGGCYTLLRWWDRWHDGKHRGERGISECLSQRERER